MLLSIPTLSPELRSHRRELAHVFLPPEMRRFSRTEPVYSPTILHDAVQAGDVDAVEQALANGANPNAKTIYALAPLHIAARLYGLKRRQDRPAQRWATIVELLLDAGADPTAKDFAGSMPAKWCEGFQPPALRARMMALAEADQWKAELGDAQRFLGRKFNLSVGGGIKVSLDQTGAGSGPSRETSAESSFGDEEDSSEAWATFCSEEAGGLCETSEEDFLTQDFRFDS